MRAVVVIPIYTNLNDFELKSLENNLKQLSAYDCVLVVPRDFQPDSITKRFPQLDVLHVSSQWLGTTNGLDGYNDMMLSSDFYNLFRAYDYMLICHVDAWIFYGERLESWLNKGYDCVAAPWLVRNRWFYRLMGHTDMSTAKGRHYMLNKKIGNGGLSLRKINVFAHEAECKRDIFRQMLKSDMQEDMIWAMDENLIFPLWNEALQFSFDTKPDYAFRLNNNQLPFGCHKWFGKAYYEFWKSFIPNS